MRGEIVHAGCVALWRPDGWRGALIQGASGAGKSDLALRLLDEGFRLVADDRTQVWPCDGRLFAACPAPIAGLLEARGVGIVTAPAIRLAEVALVVRCAAADQPIERLPEDESISLCGIAAPLLWLHPFESSAPAKLRRALTSIGVGAQRAYQARGGGAAQGVSVRGRV